MLDPAATDTMKMLGFHWPYLFDCVSARVSRNVAVTDSRPTMSAHADANSASSGWPHRCRIACNIGGRRVL